MIFYVIKTPTSTPGKLMGQWLGMGMGLDDGIPCWAFRSGAQETRWAEGGARWAGECKAEGRELLLLSEWCGKWELKWAFEGGSENHKTEGQRGRINSQAWKNKRTPTKIWPPLALVLGFSIFISQHQIF